MDMVRQHTRCLVAGREPSRTDVFLALCGLQRVFFPHKRTHMAEKKEPCPGGLILPGQVMKQENKSG